MARNTGSGTLVYVTIAGYTGLKYAFKSRAKDSVKTDLGQTVIDFAAQDFDITGIALGVNSPKPARASKRTVASGYEGSYVDSAKILSAKKAGYTITRSKRKLPPDGIGVSCYVTLNGIKYAWTRSSFPAGIAIADLGITSATADTEGLVWGASFPKPPRAWKNLSDGSRFETYYDPSKKSTVTAEDKDFSVSTGRYTLAALKEM